MHKNTSIADQQPNSMNEWQILVDAVDSKFSKKIPENSRLIPAHQSNKFPESGIALEIIRNPTLICAHRTIVVLDGDGSPVKSCQIGDIERAKRIYKNKKCTHIGGSLALSTSLAPECYYHWLLDTMPGFEVLEATGHKVGTTDLFYISNFCQNFQKESLSKYGITEDRVLSTFSQVDYSEETVLHAKFDKILIPRFRDLDGGWPNRWIIPRLQKRFQSHEVWKKAPATTNDTSVNKLYVTRGISRRRVINENAILPYLEKAGFKVVDMSKISLSEQVKIAASADLICGAHGAGLSNSLFAKPGTKLIEFCGAYLSRHFRILAELAELDYSVLNVGVDARGRKLETSNAIDKRSLDFHVDVNGFSTALGKHLA